MENPTCHARLAEFTRFLIATATGAVALPAFEQNPASQDTQHDPDSTRIVVRFSDSLRAEPATGRLLILMAASGSGEDPLDAPFWTNPQPIYSIAVKDAKPGDAMTVGSDAASFPIPLAELAGSYALRAVLDADTSTASFTEWSGNLISEKTTVRFDPAVPRTVEINLSSAIEIPTTADTDRVKLVEVRSEKLSAFRGHDVFLHAGVVLPPGYDDPANANRSYAAVYHSPGFGGRHIDAWNEGRRLFGPSTLDKNVLHVYLDPDGPFGHTLFVNSDNNGPVGDALVEELIPAIESRFRLVAKAEARLLRGHSSGGFSSVWLQVIYPNTFGGCWASSPDPVDFRAFQQVNLYDDASAYASADGTDRPSVLVHGNTVCTIRQENGMENAIDPDGASGQQWDSWFAMASPRGTNGLPVAPWDPVTGAIDHAVAERWKSRDVNLIIQKRWSDIGPMLCRSLRIMVGDADNFSLHLAVMHLNDTLNALSGWRSDWSTDAERAANGYIEIIPGRDHFNLVDGTLRRRIEKEMLGHLEQAGLIRPDPASPSR